MDPQPASNKVPTYEELLERVAQLEQRQELSSQRILDHLTEGCALLSADWVYLYVNEANAHHAHLTREQMVGRNMLALIPGVERSPFFETFRRCMETRTRQRVEAKFTFADGSSAWYEAKAEPVPEGIFVLSQDITERKRAEELLRQSEEQFRSLAAHLPSILMRYDREFRVEYLSPPAVAITAVPVDQCLGKTNREMGMPEELCAVWEHAIDAVFRTGVIRELEFDFPSTDGPRTFLLRFAPERDADGTVVHVLGISTDITERKQAQSRAVQTQRTFVELIDRAPFGIYIVDSRFCIAHMNAASQAGAFRNVRPVIGRDFSEAMRILWPEPVASGIIAAFRHTLDTGEPYQSPRFFNPRHDVDAVEGYEWELHRMTMPDGQNGVICYFFDSTALRQAEESLFASNQRLNALMNSLPVGVSFSDDPTCERITGNPAALAQFEVTASDNLSASAPDPAAPGRQLRFFRDGQPITDADLPLQRAVAERREIEPIELEVRLPSGRRWFASASGAPVRDSKGNVVGGVSVTLDITDRKLAEQAVQKANAALAEADRRKDEFIALLSHELRNPLAPIRYALPVLEGVSPSAPVRHAIGVIERQVAYLTRLVDDLLDVSRVTTGKLELRRARVALATVVRAAVEAAAPSVAAGLHSLHVELPDEPLWVNGDAIRLSQVTTNLLDNAAKYTPKGGRLELVAEREGQQAVIRVRDNGIGIPSQALPTVFEMFHQVDRVDKVQGGLGIGLGLVKTLVDMHDGQVEARSAGVGRGSEFIVRLPLAGAVEPGPGDSPAVDTPPAMRRLKVLVVDDNVDLVELLALFVKSVGHDVQRAFNGADALSVAAVYRPDVVLLDLGLPGMSGLDVARELRRRPETANTYLVAVTGWGQAKDVEQTRTAGFNSHLTKPTEAEALKRLLSLVSAADRGTSGK